MAEEQAEAVPVWTLTTQNVDVPAVIDGGVMTPERLGELRSVLALLAATPITTLEAHPTPKNLDRSRGLPLDAASPLATHLSQLVTHTPKAAALAGGGELLYRMVVPAKVAAQMGSGLVKPMAAKAGGVHGALVGASGIAAQARFVPVTAVAVDGSGAAVGVAAAGALTIAAPLVLMVVAAGLSAHAEHTQQQAMERMTQLLEKLHDDSLRRERSALNGCRSAIEKATAILLDGAAIGDSIGLGPAVHSIEVGLADAEDRLSKWQQILAKFGDRPVELAKLRTAFTGIEKDDGEFRAHLELAALAIALKKRVNVLQAVEHAQMDSSNPFENFVRVLQSDQKRAIELESGITALLRKLSTLQLDRSHGVRDFVFSSGEVDELLRTSYKLRELGEGLDDGAFGDVTIEMVREVDGSLVVFPAISA